MCSDLTPGEGLAQQMRPHPKASKLPSRGSQEVQMLILCSADFSLKGQSLVLRRLL